MLVAQNIQCRILQQLLKEVIAIMWMEVVVAYSEVLFHNLPG